jgi:hypothetical protein
MEERESKDPYFFFVFHACTHRPLLATNQPYTHLVVAMG